MDILDIRLTSDLARFEIMYNDLNVNAQIRLCETFNTHPDEENWDVHPLAIVLRQMD
jgi:hypothetical protein